MIKEKNRIVVMGGSFNPPTAAHYKLMISTVDALEADMGFFVPVSDAYLKRKMRHSHPPIVLPPELRVKMLQTICAEDSRLQVSSHPNVRIMLSGKSMPVVRLTKLLKRGKSRLRTQDGKRSNSASWSQSLRPSSNRVLP